ncbi:MAG: ribonuclease H-like domain-containing protein [Armatimonadota bacterium]|nr:ribonuclease H-like domain-containing protein [Armatimonadota bacterium]MCX7778343.1 ribonuclease H-like domain-containing protein [Armatimonadota bacterium]MDW8026405.1 ribonuclease H-like domain-containing protein [Armatimonadota bacterium]
MFKETLLRATFIHLPGVGEKRERIWWRMGITSWERWLCECNRGTLKHVLTSWRELIEKSIAALREGNAYFFASMLPKVEHWRCYRDFQESVVFLDIETTGTSDDDHITIVGLYDGYHYRTFIRGYNIQDLFEELHGKAIVVTYYGSRFDIPFLQRRFPNIRIPPIHIDLCYLMKRLGYKGGLKTVERQLGIVRDHEIDGLSGWDAVRLWNSYERYNDGYALELLIKYNRADTVNLKPLMEFAYSEMALRLWLSAIER